MSKTFQQDRRVEFCDTDAAGIAHFSVYFTWMEQTEHALLRHLGLSVFSPVDGGVLSWPRVSARCEFRAPARFEDLLQIQVTIARLGSKSIDFHFIFRRDGTLLAEGHLIAACCLMRPNQAPQAVPIPETIRRILEPFVESVGE